MRSSLTTSLAAAVRPGTSAAASPIDGSTIQLAVVTVGAGRVSITASATNASVPSEPTMSRRKISSGVKVRVVAETA
jgi:hypothetical protein